MPVSERSHVFFNLGRYAQQPLYNSAYQNTGIGTVAGEVGGDICDDVAVTPGTEQCHPLVSGSWQAPYVGNPNLAMERTTSYEIGLATEIAENVALQVVAFGKEQSALSGLAQGGVTDQGTWAYDVGNTYGSYRYDSVNGYWYDYVLITNRERQLVRGVELSLHRRLSKLQCTSAWATRRRSVGTYSMPSFGTHN